MLLKEINLNVGIDPSEMSPADAVMKVKQMYKTATASPDRAIRMRQKNLKSQKKEIQAADDPLQSERLAIQALEDRLAKMKLALAKKEEQLAKQAGEEPGEAGAPEEMAAGGIA